MTHDEQPPMATDVAQTAKPSTDVAQTAKPSTDVAQGAGPSANATDAAMAAADVIPAASPRAATAPAAVVAPLPAATAQVAHALPPMLQGDSAPAHAPTLAVPADDVRKPAAGNVRPQVATAPDKVTAARRLDQAAASLRAGWRMAIARPRTRLSPGTMRAGATAAGALVAFGLGLLAAGHGFGLASNAGTMPKAQLAKLLADMQATAAAGLDRTQNETRRLSGDVRALKDSVDAIKVGGERSRPDPDLRALKAGVEAVKDGIERLKQDQANRLAQIDAGGKFNQLVERLDRIERQVAAASKQAAAAPPASSDAAATGSIGDAKPAAKAPQAIVPPQATVPPQAAMTPPAGVPQPASVPQPAPKARLAAVPPPAPKAPLAGWILRDVYDGRALIEGREGLVEVSPGTTIPGLGRVDAIRRDGKEWVVMTSKGFIAAPRRTAEPGLVPGRSMP